MQQTEGSRIRQATEEDLFELLVLAYEFIKEAPEHMKPFDKSTMEERLTNLVASEEGVVLVLEIDGEIQGLLAAVCCAPWFTSKNFAVELGWYVRKAFRKGTGSIKLVKKYEEWAKSKGMTHAHMSDLTQLQGLGKLYERLGYSLIETSYIKEV